VPFGKNKKRLVGPVDSGTYYIPESDAEAGRG
jgi:hypothetical protein